MQPHFTYSQRGKVQSSQDHLLSCISVYCIPEKYITPRLFPLVATHFPFYRGIISLLNYINLGIAASINLHFICCSLFDGKAITHANILCSYSIYLSIYSYPRKSTLSSPSSVVCTVSNKSTGIIYNPIKVYLKQKYEL